MTISLERSPITQPKIGERRVIFYGLNWQRYQQILQALGNNRSARLTYDEGTLEITMPLEDHDYAVRLIELFIRVLVVEMGLKIKTMGSTTLDREDLNRGAEPDGGYYIKNQPLVKGRNVDLSKDPPPDLIVEVDITHSDINKFLLYAKMGVPEFWRYDGQALRIYQLQEGEYCEADASPTFPTVPKTKLYEFLEQAREDEVEAELALREWVRSQASTN
jgi:Uma2 family endonuclease